MTSVKKKNKKISDGHDGAGCKADRGRPGPASFCHLSSSEYFFTILTVVSPYCSRVAVQSRLCSGVPVPEGCPVTTLTVLPGLSTLQKFQLCEVLDVVTAAPPHRDPPSCVRPHPIPYPFTRSRGGLPPYLTTLCCPSHSLIAKYICIYIEREINKYIHIIIFSRYFLP